MRKEITNLHRTDEEVLNIYVMIIVSLEYVPS